MRRSIYLLALLVFVGLSFGGQVHLQKISRIDINPTLAVDADGQIVYAGVGGALKDPALVAVDPGVALGVFVADGGGLGEEEDAVGEIKPGGDPGPGAVGGLSVDLGASGGDVLADAGRAGEVVGDGSLGGIGDLEPPVHEAVGVVVVWVVALGPGPVGFEVGVPELGQAAAGEGEGLVDGAAGAVDSSAAPQTSPGGD